MDSQKSTLDAPDHAPQNPQNPPPEASSRWRRMLVAAAPVALIVAITAGMRLVAGSDAADLEQTLRTKRRAVTSSQNVAGTPQVTGSHVGGPPASRVADATTTKKVTQVVGKQLAAIQRGDFQTALDQSAPEMRSTVSRESFTMMIQRTYRPMLQAGKIEYGQVRVSGNSANMTVILKPAKEPQTLYRYSLASSGDQSEWYVVGVSEDVIPGFGSPDYMIPGRPGRNGNGLMPRPVN